MKRIVTGENLESDCAPSRAVPAARYQVRQRHIADTPDRRDGGSCDF